MNEFDPDKASDLARLVAERVVFFLWIRKVVPDRSGATAQALKKEIEGVAVDALIVGQ